MLLEITILGTFLFFCFIKLCLHYMCGAGSALLFSSAKQTLKHYSMCGANFLQTRNGVMHCFCSSACTLLAPHSRPLLRGTRQGACALCTVGRKPTVSSCRGILVRSVICLFSLVKCKNPGYTIIA